MAIVYIIRGDFGRVLGDNGFTRDEYAALDYADYDYCRRQADLLGATVEMVDTDKREAKRDKEIARKKRAKENRKAREDGMRSCGLKKVRGNFGGIYWE